MGINRVNAITPFPLDFHADQDLFHLLQRPVLEHPGVVFLNIHEFSGFSMAQSVEKAVDDHFLVFRFELLERFCNELVFFTDLDLGFWERVIGFHRLVKLDIFLLGAVVIDHLVVGDPVQPGLEVLEFSRFLLSAHKLVGFQENRFSQVFSRLYAADFVVDVGEDFFEVAVVQNAEGLCITFDGQVSQFRVFQLGELMWFCCCRHVRLLVRTESVWIK